MKKKMLLAILALGFLSIGSLAQAWGYYGWGPYYGYYGYDDGYHHWWHHRHHQCCGY